MAKLGASPVSTTRTIAYSYDGLARLTGAAESVGATYAYTYDVSGNRTDTAVNDTPTQHLAYDPADQVVGWSYDAAGNLLNDGSGHTYAYDALDRLTGNTATGTPQEGYGYDGDGVLITQTVGTTTTTYARDLASDETQILVAQTQGVTPTDYLYGQDRLAAEDSGASAHTWYASDPQGSVRYLQDDSAQPGSAVVAYDPFGTPEGGAGAAPPSPFGYDGELQDPQTGLLDLRARFYAPGNGQFVQRDPLEDATAQPYAYASDDPVNNADPSGQCYIPNTYRDAALPDVPPDDQTCQAQTVANLTLTPHPGAAIIYPSAADKDCIYAQVLRQAQHARSLLLQGFYVSPAQAVRSHVQTNGTAVDRIFTGFVAIGGGALAVAEKVAAATTEIGTDLDTAGPIIRLTPPEILFAVVAGTFAGIVTQPTLHDADTPLNVLMSAEPQLRRKRRRGLPTVCFSLALNTRPRGCSSLGPKRDADPEGILVPEIALHILQAQISGYPVVLTYFGVDKKRKNDNRNATCGSHKSQREKDVNEALGITSGSDLTCDEYPFATTIEGGNPNNVSLKAVPGAQNRKQGSILSDFYRYQFGYQGPARPFNVRVVP